MAPSHSWHPFCALYFSPTRYQSPGTCRHLLRTLSLPRRLHFRLSFTTSLPNSISGPAPLCDGLFQPFYPTFLQVASVFLPPDSFLAVSNTCRQLLVAILRAESNETSAFLPPLIEFHFSQLHHPLVTLDRVSKDSKDGFTKPTLTS
eukprot:c30251_g1_i1 orf=185-625(-)